MELHQWENQGEHTSDILLGCLSLESPAIPTYSYKEIWFFKMWSIRLVTGSLGQSNKHQNAQGLEDSPIFTLETCT